MPARSLSLNGYGQISLVPVSIKDKKSETTDNEGNVVTKEMVGARAKTIYKNPSGVEISSRNLCKKFEIDGETIVAPKINPTSTIDQEDIVVEDENTEIYNAIERKIYSVSTDSVKIKDLLLKQGKTIKFDGFVAGLGWKAYKGVLTAYQGKIIMVGCRGDMNVALDTFKDDVVDLELELMPNKDVAKKLLKAIAV